MGVLTGCSPGWTGQADEPWLSATLVQGMQWGNKRLKLSRHSRCSALQGCELRAVLYGGEAGLL